MGSDPAQTHQALMGVVSVLELELEAARADYAEVSNAVRALEQHLAALREETRSGLEQASNAYAATGADLVWRNWVARRRSAMMQDLAQLKARREAVRERLKLANGKAKALKAVAEQEQQKMRAAKARIAEKQSEFMTLAARLSR